MKNRFTARISTRSLGKLLETANTTTDPAKASLTLSSLITLQGQISEQLDSLIRDQSTHRDVGGEDFEYIEDDYINRLEVFSGVSMMCADAIATLREAGHVTGINTPLRTVA